MDAIAPYEPSEERVESQTLPSQEAGATPIQMEEEESQTNGHDPNSRKRARSPADDDMVDGFLPAAAAMKKRKLVIEQQKNGEGLDPDHNLANKRSQAVTRKPQAKKDIDVRKVARERREAEEEAARREQEGLDAPLGDISVEDMKKLAVIVEMEVPSRAERAAGAEGMKSDRWDEKWNGRKNFKRFRRKGEGGDPPRRQTQNVIVPLVEVKRKNYGIGEAYWSSSHDRGNNSGHQNSRNGGISSQTQTQTQTQSLTGESGSPTMTRLQQEAADIVGAIDVERPRQTRLADKTQQTQNTMNSSRGKRPASSAASGPAKKQRTIRTRAASDSESDEELRFKFGSRKG